MFRTIEMWDYLAKANLPSGLYTYYNVSEFGRIAGGGKIEELKKKQEEGLKGRARTSFINVCCGPAT